MAIAFVGAAFNSVGDSEDVAVTPHASTVTGNLMLFFYTNGNDDNSPIELSGWTEIDTIFSTVGSDRSLGLFYLIATGSEPQEHTATGTTSTSNLTSGTILTFSGCHASTPIDVTYDAGTHHHLDENDTTPTAKAITTVTDGAEVVIMTMCKGTAVSAFVQPSGYTVRQTNIEGSRNITMASKNVTSAGLETPGNWTMTDSDGTDDPAGFTIALRPAAAAGGVAGVIRRRRH